MSEDKEIVIHSQRSLEVAVSDVTGSAIHPKNTVKSESKGAGPDHALEHPVGAVNRQVVTGAVPLAADDTDGSALVDAVTAPPPNIQFANENKNSANDAAIVTSNELKHVEFSPEVEFAADNRRMVDAVDQSAAQAYAVLPDSSRDAELVSIADLTSGGDGDPDAASPRALNMQLIAGESRGDNRAHVEGGAGHGAEKAAGEHLFEATLEKLATELEELSGKESAQDSSPAKTADVESAGAESSAIAAVAVADSAVSQIVTDDMRNLQAAPGQSKSRNIQVSAEVLQHMRAVAEETARIAAKAEELAKQYQAIEKGSPK